MRTINDIHEIIDWNLISTWFQPIIRATDGRIHAYEALSRGPLNSPLHAPLKLFEAAERVGRLGELERCCVVSAIANFHRLKLPGRLFFNVGPETLLDRDFQYGETQALMRRCGLSHDRIVIEVTEHRPLTELDQIQSAIRHFRAQGFAIALDDLGTGYASLQLWSQLYPDYVKIDRHFVSGMDQGPVKREFVRSIIEIARTVGCQVVGEGVETEGEHTVLRSLGVDLIQGFYVERPSSSPSTELDTGRLTKTAPTASPKDNQTIQSLCRERQSVTPETRVETLATLFRESPGVTAIAVTNERCPKGVVYRPDLMELLSTPSLANQWRQETVGQLMQSNPLIVESGWTLEHASKLVTSQEAPYRARDFIITENGFYKGMGQVADLLAHITHLQVQTASHVNPLTSLPGMIPLHKTFDRLLEEGASFSLCYYELHHFKSFNDRYGYARGNEVLLCLAQLLRQTMMGDNEFVAHIRGDNFVTVYRAGDWRTRVGQTVQRFANEMRAFQQWEHHQVVSLGSGVYCGDSHPCSLSLTANALEIHPGQFRKATALANALDKIRLTSKAKVVPDNRLKAAANE